MQSNLDKINHIVVLMLENRSFDQMLGWLYDSASPNFNGVAGKNLSNPIPAYAIESERGVVPVGQGTVMTNPMPDPGEEYYHVNTQLFGTILPPENRSKPFNRSPYNLPEPLPSSAPMNGFVMDYINNFTGLIGRAPTYAEYKIIMDCFTPEQVPVISALARSYAVCDRWHCSVPSQTFCNRAFVHSATSNGFVVNAPYLNWLFTTAPTIFNRIEDDPRRDLTWKIYFDRQDGLSLTGLLQPTLWPYLETHFAHMEQFYQDAAAGTLPSYAFIEPRLLLNHNDQHPPAADLGDTSSVLAGELLINEIYQALRHGKNWESTLFIITYDEHGGCYDHVAPPTATPPQPMPAAGQFGFGFDRLGVRVPTVLVSPYIEAGTVVNTLFDHTSIIKTITQRWGLPGLTRRDQIANDLSEVLNRSEPRQDFPVITPRPYTPTFPPENEPLSNLQRAILMVVAGWQALDRIDKDKYLLEKLLDVVEVSEAELEIVFKLKTVGEANSFIQERLPLARKPGCLSRLEFWRYL